MTLQSMLAKLPIWLQPRGTRYQAASQTQVATLSNRRIFILPTHQGLLFAGVLAVMLLGATNYSNSMMFVLSFWLLSVALLSMIYTYRNMAGIDIRLVDSEPCHAGGHTLFRLMLGNHSSRSREDIHILVNKTIYGCESVAANDQTVVDLALPAPHRGRQKLGRITIAATYPLGLFRAWAYVDMEAEALIYPAPAESAPPPEYGSEGGERKETGEIGADDFHGFRNYVPGDSMRQINWRALAREQGLVTKEFQRHQSPELWFDWLAAPGADMEARLSVLCRWLLDAELHQQYYGLKMPGVTIEPGQGPHHLTQCLSRLALFGETP